VSHRDVLVERARAGLPGLLAQVLRDVAPARIAVRAEGRVVSVDGTVIRGRLPDSAIGLLCHVESDGVDGLAEVVGFDALDTILAPLGRIDGMARGARIVSLGARHSMAFPRSPLGVIFDGFGRVIGRIPDGGSSGGPANPGRVLSDWVPMPARAVVGEPPEATARPPVRMPLTTGIRAIDGLLTLGRGQRIGVFAPAGCGKTTLLAALARGCDADAIVFALIGERGRELREFIEHAIPPSLAGRCVVVCATSDRTPLERSRAASTATTIAEALRDQGKDVLLLVDSVTRFARAQRDVGLAAGETVSRGGLTPSVYAMLPRVIERAGAAPIGSITAVYTVLVEGEMRTDPLADEIKSLLDGHFVLSADLADQGHFPAIDVLASLSRLQPVLVGDAHRAAATAMRAVIAKHREMAFLIRVGEYRPGHDLEADHAVETHPRVVRFLQQDLREPEPFDATLDALCEVTR
jgi:type III secretion protein N (ATPase)